MRTVQDKELLKYRCIHIIPKSNFFRFLFSLTFFVVFILFFFLATPMAYGRSQARDQIQAAAATYATAAAMPDP